MSETYFWSFGRCRHCGWPHHMRRDVKSRPGRRFLWWHRPERPGYSLAICCNCGRRTEIECVPGEAQ